MNGMRFAAALALICTNSIFAGEPGADAAAGNQVAAAKSPIQPPYVVQLPYRIEPPDVIRINMPKEPKATGLQPVTGQYLVGPDGTINLRQFGVVYISGMTATEASAAVRDHLKQFFDPPKLSVDVVAGNSKVYYVITETAGQESVRRMPISGIVTVLDAIGNLKESSQIDSNKLWIARPAAGSGKRQTLPIDWDAIAKHAEMTTNYQILPGDRLYVTANAPVPDAKATVISFLEAFRKGDNDEATKLLTKVARKKVEEARLSVAPPANERVKIEVDNAVYPTTDHNTARVPTRWVDRDDDGKLRTDTATWICRLEPEGWRVAGFEAFVFKGEAPLSLSFEDPERMADKQKWLAEEFERRARQETPAADTKKTESTPE